MAATNYDHYCPLCDFRESGENNLPKESCLIRQKDPSQPVCYGGCKARQELAKHDRVKRAAEAAGHDTKGRPAIRILPEDREQVVGLLREDLSYSEIQRRTNINRNQIGKIARNMVEDGELPSRRRGR